MSDIVYRVAKRHLEARSQVSFFSEMDGARDAYRFRREITKLFPDHTDVSEVYLKIIETLTDRYSVDVATDMAFNKLRNLVSKGSSSPDLVRNQVFKIADLLDIKLPHGLF